MNEDNPRQRIGLVKQGSLSRRDFVKRIATQLLAVTGAVPPCPGTHQLAQHELRIQHPESQ